MACFSIVLSFAKYLKIWWSCYRKEFFVRVYSYKLTLCAPSTIRLNSSGSAVTALKGAAVVDAQREEELEAKRVREVRTIHSVGC